MMSALEGTLITIDSVPILREVFEYFVADPIGPQLNLHRTAGDSENPISFKIAEQLTLLPVARIAAVKADKLFQFFSCIGEGSDLDREARLWLLKQLLSEGIPEFRLKTLMDFSGIKRPLPYEHPAVADLELDSDCMVPLRSFRVRAGALFRAGTGFTILLPTESTNSQYWLIQSLMQAHLQDVTNIRLDPLIVRPAEDYACMEYRMWWYGRALDWSRIDALKAEEHGRWAPGKLSNQAAYTDFAWTPRDGEVHFRCEEIPLKDSVQFRGSRYFHAVYSLGKKRVIHLDGAIRIYNTDEWDKRHASHVRNLGKIGKRIKVFRIDAELRRDSMGQICSNFFVWNHDVARYFGADIPEGL